MARFVHVSDTHLGYQAYGKLTEDGLNQREVDFQDSFRRVVDWCVEHKPDFVLHTGDLFDSPRPSNRAIAFALRHVRRLDEAEVPTLLLSGNHDAPRLRETGSIFRIFEGMPHVRPVYRGVCERVPFETDDGRVVVHAVPQAIHQQAFQQELAALEPQPDVRNVLAVHGTVAGVDGLFTNELNDLLIPESALRPEFDYIALGHFHGHRRIADRAYYAGSTERSSIHEAEQKKTFSEVILDGTDLDIRTHATGARPMRDVGPVDASGVSPDALADRLAEAVAGVPAGAVVRVAVRDVDRATLRAVDLGPMYEAADDALHVAFHPTIREEAQDVQLPTRLGHLDEELTAFLEKYPLDGMPRDDVREAAVQLLAEAQEDPDAS